MDVELKLANLKHFSKKPFVFIPKKYRVMAGINGPTSVIITLKEKIFEGILYCYRCKIMKKDITATNDTDFSSKISEHGLMRLPPELSTTKRMVLEYDEDDKCLVIWSYID